MQWKQKMLYDKMTKDTDMHKFQVTWTDDMVQCTFQNEKLQREVGVSFLHIHEFHPENQSSSLVWNQAAIFMNKEYGERLGQICPLWKDIV